MKIANPIYDVVFKYLMENNEIAKDILSAILNEEIVSVELQSQEFTETSATGIQVFRLDFKAIIRTKLGDLKTSLIEIQKTKGGFKIGRFQTYLGFNYMKSHIILKENEQPKDERYPITAIYFLGFRLKNVKVPVLKVERQYFNAVSNRKLNVKEDFVEKLSHDLYAIQIPRLKMHIRTELEQMLDVFNQKKYKTTDNHILEYTGTTNDPRVARVVKHLGRAIVSNPDLLHAMVMEDFMEAEAERERIEMERERIAKEEAIEGRKAAILEKKLAIQDKELAIQDKELAIQDKELAIQDKELAIQASEEERQAKEIAIQNAEAERKEKEFWKAQFEAIQQKNKDEN
jgi:hypothetical protein